MEDTVFPKEVYVTAESTWNQVGRLLTESPGNTAQQQFQPVIQPLENLANGRRVAIYVLKEIKELKVRRELV